MNYKTGILQKTQLFAGLEEEELLSAVECFRLSEREYDKDAVVLRAGESPDTIGVVLSGSIIIFSNDFWGNRTIVEKMSSGRIVEESVNKKPLSPERIDW